MKIKAIRKIFLFCIVIACILSISGCARKTTYTLGQEDANITGIEIVNIDVSVSAEYPLDYISDSFETLMTIEKEKYEDFLKDFRKMTCYCYYDPIDDVSGTVIRITYQNGSYELIGRYCGYYYDVDQNGTKGGYKFRTFEEEEFKDFLNTYLAG